MKRYGLLLCSILWLSTAFGAPEDQEITHVSPITSYKPLLAIIIMVKNEEQVIVPTLEPYIQAGIKHFFVFDTGSEDQTKQRARELFDKHQLKHAYIMEEPFVQFDVSRNRALDLAQEKFPNAAFFLMIDAEWYMHNTAELISFCKKQLAMHQEHHIALPACYGIRLTSNVEEGAQARLFWCPAKVRFAGHPHEAPTVPPCMDEPHKVPRTIYFEYSPSRYGLEKTQKRFQRDVEALTKSFEQDPTQPRTTFYLAQSHQCLGNLKQAHHYYTMRSKLLGWPEENFITIYRLGFITELLTQTDAEFTWKEAEEYYLKAHTLNPHRAEPLVRLAQYYWKQGDIPRCFLYAQRAYHLPFPENDVLFIEKHVYEFERYELVSKSAWHVGEYTLGEEATRKVIAYDPQEPQWYRNLAAYIEQQKNRKRA